MVQSTIFQRYALILSCFFLPPCKASLFLTPQEKSEAQQFTKPTITNNQSLKLRGILYRPDSKYWLIWINDHRIDSRRPYSIDGWTVATVRSDSVIMRSLSGQEMELTVSIAPDDSSTQETQSSPADIADITLPKENPPPVKAPPPIPGIAPSNNPSFLKD